jgi:hypothetical protein
MATFGQHETAQRLFLSGVGGIYALKSDDKKVIKVLQPPVGIWSPDRIQEEIDAFRRRAQCQQTVAKASRNWAPIHEIAALRDAPSDAAPAPEESSGAAFAPGVASGAYAVMDRYERSAQSLIDGRVNLLNADLRNIMSGVVQGLIDIRKNGGGGKAGGAGRPHGALKPSNVLLANTTDLATATVHLSDPSPDGTLNDQSHAKDLADLGRMLFELVNLHPYDGGVIQDTKDWKELGPNGRDWLKLCNALLDPHAPAEERDLEQVQAKIQTWTLKPKKSKAPLFAGIAAVLLIAGGITAYILTRPVPVPFDQERWDTYALSYYSWFGDFADAMYRPENRDRFRKDPWPTEIAKLFDDAIKELDKLDPKSIARDTGREWTDRVANPTDSVKVGDGPRYTKKGLELMESVDAALTPAHWPLLKSLDDTAKRYESYGWQKPAGGIRAVIAAARPPVLPEVHPEKPQDILDRIKQVEKDRQTRKETIFDSVRRTIDAQKSIADIDARWTGIQDKLKAFRAGDATTVPLLKDLPDFAERLPRSQAAPDDPGTLADVTALAAAFTTIGDVLTKLNGALNTPGREIVFAELAKDPKASGTPSLDAYAALAEIVPQYLKLTDDPRGKVAADWKARTPQVQSDMDDFLKAASATVPDAKTHLDDLSARVKALNDALAAAAVIPAIEKNRDQLAQAAADSAATLDKLVQDSLTWSAPFKTDPVQYVKEKRDYLATSPLAKATPIVYDAWKAAHTRYLDKVEQTKDDLRKDYNYKLSVDDAFKRLEAVYAGIEAALPLKVPGLSDIAGTDWRHTIAAHVATAYRETALKDLLAALPAPSPDVPDAADQSFTSRKAEILAAFEKSRTDTLALIADYTTILDRLDHLDLQANEPAPGAPSWRDLFTKWNPAEGSAKNPLLADQVITAALKPLTDRIAALLAIDSHADYKTLLADAQSLTPEIALTAWRKLGTIAITEDLPVLDDEEKLQTALSTQFKSNQALDAPRQQRLTAELVAQRPLRWRRWVDVIKTAPSIQTALDKIPAFNVTLSPQTDANLIFNQAFYLLRKEMAKNPTEQQLKPVAQKFIDDVGLMPPAISANTDIQDLLARMTKSLSAKQDESANGAGPQLAKWEIDTSREGFRTFYFPNKAGAKYTLTFVRLQVNESSIPAGSGGGQKTIYLCTTEMPVGLFIDSFNTFGKIDDLDNDKHPDQAHWFKVPAQKKDDVYLSNGPRAWRIVDRKFTVNQDWLDDAGPQMIGQPSYPPNATPPAPRATDPLQLISPWSAMYAARLLGCRLPTFDEWKTAYDTFEAPAAPAAPPPKDIWNLRGEGPAGKPSWRTQQDYAAQMNAKGLQYPDKGIFVPSKLLFSSIFADKAAPWTADALAKIAPARITGSPTPYQHNSLWFQEIDKETVPAGSAAPALVMHHLVGNVAEFVFDGDTATAVIPNSTPSIAAIEDTLKNNAGRVFVVGGSALSPPDIPFHEKQPVSLSTPAAKSGFCDVGLRLTYTAPIDSILDVLVNAFKDPKYLPAH